MAHFESWQRPHIMAAEVNEDKSAYQQGKTKKTDSL